VSLHHNTSAAQIPPAIRLPLNYASLFYSEYLKYGKTKNMVFDKCNIRRGWHGTRLQVVAVEGVNYTLRVRWEMWAAL
jgi:hypothetical protein